LPTRIKICGITRPEDALRAAELGADAIGLIFFAGSARHVTVPRALEVIARLPPFVTTVGLFVDAPRAEVDAVLSAVPLDLLQFHGNETPAYCESFDRPYIKAIAAAPGVDLLQSAGFHAKARALLVDAYVPGVASSIGFTPAGDIAATNVQTAIQELDSEKGPRTSTTGAAVIPSGTEAQRPTPATGQLRFNTDATSFEGYNGTEWGSIGGGATSDAIYENSATITENITIVTGRNGMSTGPITINSGVTVTVESGARYVVI
jgi:phosphoribosylanthranilate isomerase